MKGAILSVLVLSIFMALAIFAPLLAPHDPKRTNVHAILRPPMWMNGGNILYPLGTDGLGRDVLSRLIFGSRISLLVGLTVVAIGGTFGTILGVISGFYGGLVDDIIMRLVDIQLAFPFILLVIAFLAVLGPGLQNLIIALAIGSWVIYARVVRGQVISLREKMFVEAARVTGVRDSSIIFRHILPNAFSSVIVIASFEIARAIISEASLSFLGLGVRPSTPTWGSMLANGLEYITDGWWMIIFPGLAIMVTVLSINILGDWLREKLDPHRHLPRNTKSEVAPTLANT